ncbi:MAG: hypothetical protein KIH06_06060, partial [Kiritimatiellae bacterium]|nr:hypothetical protein [Kiritimatiellia bacterium]
MTSTSRTRSAGSRRSNSTDRSTSRPQTRRVSQRTRSAASTPSAASTFRNDTFFGEQLPEEAFVKSQELAIRSDVFLVLGTSLT